MERANVYVEERPMANGWGVHRQTIWRFGWNSILGR
jgi:hypothetical protein